MVNTNILPVFTVSGREKRGKKKTNKQKHHHQQKSQTKQIKIDDTCCNSICCKTWSCCCRLHPSLAQLLRFQHPSLPAGAGCWPWKASTCPRTGPHRRLPPALHSGATIQRGLRVEPQVPGANHCPHRGGTRAGTRGAPGVPAHGQDAPSRPARTKALR